MSDHITVSIDEKDAYIQILEKALSLIKTDHDEDHGFLIGDTPLSVNSKLSIDAYKEYAKEQIEMEKKCLTT